MPGPIEEVLTVAEAAQLLRMSKNALYAAIRRGEIPHRRVGRRILCGRTALLNWLAASEAPPERPGR